jgi:hypothetical protein
VVRYRDVEGQVMAEQLRSPEELLAKALEGLPSADRQRVLIWLLGKLTGPQAGWLGKPDRDRMLALMSPGGKSLRELFGQPAGGGALAVGEDYQVMPIRLPTDLHARLRTWSAEHGFSMATVVRGLVGRFLDGQEG